MRSNPRCGGLRAPVILLALFQVGCPSSEAPTRALEEPPGHTPATTVGDFDGAAMREMLQGRWDVKQGARKLFYFEIDGDHARAVDVRFASPRFIEGKLVVRSATGFGITDQDEVTSFYSAVLSEGATFIGLGDAIKVGEGDAFEAKLSAWERLTMNAEGQCTYSKRWGGQVEDRQVECAFTKKGDREIFTYQADDRFRPGRLKRYEWVLVGGYLLSRELADSEAHKLAPGEPSSVDPGTSPGPGHAFGALGTPIPGRPTDQTGTVETGDPAGAPPAAQLPSVPPRPPSSQNLPVTDKPSTAGLQPVEGDTTSSGTPNPGDPGPGQNDTMGKPGEATP